MKEKLLNEIALFIQKLLRKHAMRYIDVREAVMKNFSLSKIKAGNIIRILGRRRNFLFLTFGYEMVSQSILYLPERGSEARKMFREIRDSIPKHIRYANRRLHNYLLSEVRKIKLQNPELSADLLAEIVRWKLKVGKYLARKLIGELENS